MRGLIPNGETVVHWIAPSGRVLPIAGFGHGDVWIGEGVDGLALPVNHIFEAGAREFGERVAGVTVDAAEYDFPLHVRAPDPEALRIRCREVEGLFERFRKGWLATYSPSRGWRFVSARRGEMALVTELDPHRSIHAAYEVTLIVESPLAREADRTSVWVNGSGSGRGQLHLYPGDGEWTTWAMFEVRGPGRVRLRWCGNDVELPRLAAGEWALVNSDEARPTIIGRGADGVEKNLWPLMPPGQRIPFPLAKREVSRVDVSVTGGSRDTYVRGRCRVLHEGLF